jgi:FkbM family methyltransferase
MKYDAIHLPPQMSEIFELLQDDESRYIYLQIAKAYFGNFYDWISSERNEMLLGVLNFAFIRRLQSKDEIHCEDSIVSLILKAKENPEEGLFLYSAYKFSGFVAKVLLSYGVGISGFIDRDPKKQGTIFLNRPVLSIDDWKREHTKGSILVANYASGASIMSDLKDAGVFNNSSYIIYSLNNMNEQHYFGPDFIKLTENEVYLDIGCYNGATIIDFINFCKKNNVNYRKIIGIESSPKRYPFVMSDVENYKNIEIVNTGAWSEKKELEFCVDFADEDVTNHEYIHTLEMRKEVIPVDKIDNITKGEEVTFIKMDIEGAELEALKGATETIKKYKPKLAICIYHRECDIVEIPRFIHQLVPQYKFYIRHHSFLPWETVLYAIP